MASPTSLNALESAKRRTPRQKDKIVNALEVFCRYHGGGLNDEELCALTGLSASTVRPRRGELVAEGLVVDSGHTRRTKSGHEATLWRLATAEEREAFEARRKERELDTLNRAVLDAWERYLELRDRHAALLREDHARRAERQREVTP